MRDFLSSKTIDYKFWLFALLLNFVAVFSHAAEPSPSTLAPSQDETPIFRLHDQEGQRFISLADVEAFPLYEVNLQHFTGLQGQFSGVWLRDWLIDQGYDQSATVRFIAHDDYSVVLTPEDLQVKDYMLVTRLDGEPLTLTNFGPTLLIVPEDADAVINGKASLTQWLWSIRDILIQ